MDPVNTQSHYDVLGVSPEASAATIRDSYRRLAREFHPDHAVGSAAGGNRMPTINAAYHVLSDPGRRAVYDAEQRGRDAATSTATSTRERYEGYADVGSQEFRRPDLPARIPWRSLLFFSAVAIIAIVVMAQFVEPSEPAAPDGILRNGDCVEILDNNDAREIPCQGAGDLVVRQFIAFDRTCSSGWQPHRDRQGMGIACVEQVPDDPGE